jgi:hypothetical protein
MEFAITLGTLTSFFPICSDTNRHDTGQALQEFDLARILYPIDGYMSNWL